MIILLVHDAEVVAVEHGTADILAEFTIDPAKGYQPKKRRIRSENRGCRRCLEASQCVRGRLAHSA